MLEKDLLDKLNIKTCAIDNCFSLPIIDQNYTAFVDVVCKSHHDEWAYKFDENYNDNGYFDSLERFIRNKNI